MWARAIAASRQSQARQSPAGWRALPVPVEPAASQSPSLPSHRQAKNQQSPNPTRPFKDTPSFQFPPKTTALRTSTSRLVSSVELYSKEGLFVASSQPRHHLQTAIMREIVSPTVPQTFPSIYYRDLPWTRPNSMAPDFYPTSSRERKLCAPEKRKQQQIHLNSRPSSICYRDSTGISS